MRDQAEKKEISESSVNNSMLDNDSARESLDSTLVDNLSMTQEIIP